MQEGKRRVFNTLHEQYQHLGLPVELIDKSMDFTIFNLRDAFKDVLPFHSPTHRLNFFVFNFIKQGKGQYTIDDQTFDMQPDMAYFTNPGHYRSYKWESIEEVYLITLSESFLKENVHAGIFEEFPFLLAETFPGRTVSPAVFAEFEQLIKLIQQEYSNHSLYRKRLIGNLFVVLLLKIKEYLWNDYDPIYEGNRSSVIVKDFKRLLEKHYRELRAGKAEQVFRVQEYADAQNLHPNYLSNVIKAKTGKSIGTWIAEKTIAEAKSLLQNSPISIKEISYQLGFAETAHFSNYFKKHTNTSPVAYRKAHQASAS